jgi:hypothetical protein
MTVAAVHLKLAVEQNFQYLQLQLQLHSLLQVLVLTHCTILEGRLAL